MEQEINENVRWQDLDRILSRGSVFRNQDADLIARSEFQKNKILVIGAGGLGCEILKNLALSGIKEIDVIDLDTIDLTNLNRQFLFRKDNIGQGKAEVAAKFIMDRVQGCKVNAFDKKIQDFNDQFYRNYKIIIAGLDNRDARQWLNQTVHNLVNYDAQGEIDVDSLIYLVDGGTERFDGQARVVIPFYTTCLKCTIGFEDKDENPNFCTIANNPRKPEHCVQFARFIQWDKEFPNTLFDNDNEDHWQWLFEKSFDRANQYNIKGVTYKFTQGVIKKIIPAVASTNAVIAAACCNEAIKLLTFCGNYLNEYIMFTGTSGVYSRTDKHPKLEDCTVCSKQPNQLTVNINSTFQQFFDQIKVDFNLVFPQFTKDDSTPLTFVFGGDEENEKRLKMTWNELIANGIYFEGQKLFVIDKNIKGSLTIRLKLQK